MKQLMSLKEMEEWCNGHDLKGLYSSIVGHLAQMEVRLSALERKTEKKKRRCIDQNRTDLA